MQQRYRASQVIRIHDADVSYVKNKGFGPESHRSYLLDPPIPRIHKIQAAELGAPQQRRALKIQKQGGYQEHCNKKTMNGCSNEFGLKTVGVTLCDRENSLSQHSKMSPIDYSKRYSLTTVLLAPNSKRPLAALQASNHDVMDCLTRYSTTRHDTCLCAGKQLEQLRRLIASENYAF